MDANQTRDQAELHGTFLVQRLHSNSGLNIVEQLPSDYLWELVESFEKRLMEYAHVSFFLDPSLLDSTLYCTAQYSTALRQCSERDIMEEDCVDGGFFGYASKISAWHVSLHRQIRIERGLLTA